MDLTKVILLAVGVFALIYVLNNNSSDPIKNEGSLSYDSNDNANLKERPSSTEGDNELPIDLDSLSPIALKPSSESNEENKRRKYRSKNMAKPGTYKASSYVEGERGNGPAPFDKYFDEADSLVVSSHMENDGFEPNDETHGGLAPYRPGKKRQLSEEDIFRAGDYLPQEKNKDWFDTPPEPISVKNRHLINVTRPVGVNTIGTSLKNPSYDIRGTVPCPKFVVSPWLQSSIEPDTNNKGLCN